MADQDVLHWKIHICLYQVAEQHGNAFTTLAVKASCKPLMTSSATAAIDNMITNHGKGNPELVNLPRKINIGLATTRDDFAHTHINDVGLYAAKDPETGKVSPPLACSVPMCRGLIQYMWGRTPCCADWQHSTAWGPTPCQSENSKEAKCLQSIR